MRSSTFVSSLGFLLLTLWSVGCHSSQPGAEEMRKLIGDQLPIGSTKTQVATFLDSRSISHSDIQEDFELDKEQRRIKTRIMTASIRHKSFWSKSQVYMVFYFDNSDRLTKYDVKNVYTSI